MTRFRLPNIQPTVDAHERKHPNYISWDTSFDQLRVKLFEEATPQSLEGQKSTSQSCIIRDLGCRVSFS